MNKLIVGMIGVGNFGGYRRQLMRQSDRFTIAAVCDRNPDLLASAAAEEKATAYTAFDEMLNHPGLEGIVVSTGADTHADFAIQAMRRGLHVFIEKPLCCSPEEAFAIRNTMVETKRTVGVGHNHCETDPLLLLAKQYIDEGLLGTVVAFEDNSSHSGGLEIRPGDWRGLAERNPGGMLFQCGVHELHALNFLFGMPTAVQAMMRYNANPVTETADAANVLLRYPSGLIGTLNSYHVTPYIHEMRIFGTKGTLYLDTFHRKAQFQERKRNAAEPRIELEVPAATTANAYGALISWFDAIRGGTPAHPGLEEGIAAVLPIFAAERAEKEKREVAISTV